MCVEEQVKRVLGDILLLDPAGIGMETTQDRVSSWDSVNHINLVYALEEEFKTTFNIREIESLTSYAEILSVLKSKNGSTGSR
jgi:acyl carrier protein